MITQQIVLTRRDELAKAGDQLGRFDPHLVLAFGHPGFFEGELLPRLGAHCAPQAQLLGCSSAGEIHHVGVATQSLVLTAVRFDRPVEMRLAWAELAGDGSQAVARRLGEQLADAGLRHVLVFAPGVDVDGSALIRGLMDSLGDGICVTGGLAGDDDAFRRTVTLGNGRLSDRGVVALGLYRGGVTVRHGCYGGWQPFGAARQVTRREGNVLLELDGKPALDVYKLYLGAHADGLPATGLLFPFAIVDDSSPDTGLIRTIIGIDEARGGLVFAGDIPAGALLRLMQARTDMLVDGAQSAAEMALAGGRGGNGLALLVSCVGRRLVMAGRVEEEVEAVAEVFGQGTTLAGYYSYGEISPLLAGVDCRLHNQTMTITYLADE